MKISDLIYGESKIFLTNHYNLLDYISYGKYGYYVSQRYLDVFID